MGLEEYKQEFDSEIKASVYGTGVSTKAAFLEAASDLLIDHELESEFQITEYEGIGYRQHRLQLDGYVYGELSNSMSLALVDYRHEDNVITATEIETIVKRARFFLEDIDYILNNAEESSPGYGLAFDIKNNAFDIQKYKIYLFTNNQMSNRIKSLESDYIGDTPIEYHVWDIARLYELSKNSELKEDFEIQFNEFSNKPIPCLSVTSGDDYQGYMACIPGIVLAKLYNKFGAKLLESNVRSFLQIRGKVNKGIRNTIIKEPNKFFAYNNGITCTADSIEVNTSGGAPLLESCRNLQIVNGGQTTASLASALLDKKEKLEDNIENIYVPMKISVVTDENSAELVANISKYANSQNKVSESDLSSNHPYHVRIEQLSRTTSAPALNGQQFGTYWYYERARGAYAQETHKATAGSKKTFEAKYPKNQKFDKTELAKLVNIFSGRPHIASAGGQKSFVYFMQEISKTWDRDSNVFHSYYFKQLVCYKIIFKATDNIVKTVHHFDSYKANIVAYTLSKLSDTIDKCYKDKSIDFEYIWQNQRISSAMRAELIKLTEIAHNHLVDENRGKQNVTEWAKKVECWVQFKDQSYTLSIEFANELVSRNKIKDGEKTGRKDLADRTEDEAMIELNKIKFSVWTNLQKWNVVHKVLSPTENDFVNCAIKIYTKGLFPSAKQCVRILKTLDRARAEGFPE